MSATHPSLPLFVASGVDADAARGRASSAPIDRTAAPAASHRAAIGPNARHWLGLAAVNGASIVGYGLSSGGFATAHWAAAAAVAAVSVAVGWAGPHGRRAAGRGTQPGRAAGGPDADEVRTLLLQARAALTERAAPPAGRGASMRR